MALLLNIGLFCFIAVNFIVTVRGEVKANSTFKICSQSKIDTETHNVDYSWTLNGMTKLVDDLNLRCRRSRVKAEFYTNTSAKHIVGKAVPGTWFFVLEKKRNDTFLRVGLINQVYSVKDQNLTVKADLALTMGQSTLFAPKYSHSDTSISKLDHASIADNYNNVTFHKYLWFLPIDDLIRLIDDAQPLSSVSPTSARNNEDDDKEMKYENDQLILTFSIDITKVVTPEFVPEDMSNDCELPNFDTRLKSAKNNGHFPRWFTPISTYRPSYYDYSTRSPYYYYTTNSPYNYYTTNSPYNYYTTNSPYNYYTSSRYQYYYSTPAPYYYFSTPPTYTRNINYGKK